jgi:hypothetical protein
MKKRFALFAGAAMIVAGVVSTGQAAPVCTDVGCVTVNEGGYALILDGAAGNPDPLDGYISVSGGGQLCADDTGSSPDDENSSPICAN